MRMVSIKCQMKEAPRTHNTWQTSPLRARAGARGLNGLGLGTSRSGLLIDSENGTSLDPRSAYGVKKVVTNTVATDHHFRGGPHAALTRGDIPLHSSDAACQVPLYTHYIFPEKIMNTVALLLLWFAYAVLRGTTVRKELKPILSCASPSRVLELDA